MDARVAHALIRFGLGYQSREPAPADADAWLTGQLDGTDPALDAPGCSAADGLAAMRGDRDDRKHDLPASQARDLFHRESDAAIDVMLTTAAPFRERLVWFWANHFTVSLRRGECTALVCAYVREAIRPYAVGRFADMLQAVMHHPAMLIYLDNASSVGPDSPEGRRAHRGLNENLARESLELHTVSTGAGYTQADVTAYANILTGWSVEQNTEPLGWRFRPNAHEPGPQTVMGRSFPAGLQGGEDALLWLADHPWTRRHVARALVRHFVADDPPPACVARVEAVLRDTGGDLKAAAVEVTRLPEAWRPLSKLRTPADYVVAVLRALDLPADKRGDVRGMMGALGQGFMDAPLPNGWSDTAADWDGPEAILRRVDWAYTMSGRAQVPDPLELADACLGPLLSRDTRAQIRHAGSRRDAVTLLLAAPEFQRR
jgi:uncharacterized protein (DUF1800 family)